MNLADRNEVAYEQLVLEQDAAPWRIKNARLPEKPLLPNWLSRLIQSCGVLTLLSMPILFGAVHQRVYLTAQILTFSLILMLFIFAAPALGNIFDNKAKLLAGVKSCALLFLGYLILQIIVFSLISSAHPILGSHTKIINFDTLLPALRSLLMFFAVFALTRVYCASLRNNSISLISLTIFITSLICFVALSHWFYDNGKLFWMFEPDSVFISERARWPFVNPNHLGYFLVPALFLTLGRFLASTDGLKRTSLDIGNKRRRRAWTTIISNVTLHLSLIRAGIFAVVALLILLTIAATLSRGTWLATSIGMLTFVFLSYLSKPKTTQASSELDLNINAVPRSRKHSRNRERNRTFNIERFFTLAARFIRPLAFLFALFIFYLFLNQKGAELVGARIEYGLLYTTDDIRAVLYADTFKMIAAHPLFGVGIGGWAAAFPSYMSTEISGINPVYLHSDPLQIIAEVGLVGVLPLLALVFLFFRYSLRAIKVIPAPRKYILIGLLSGITGFLFGSFFDFPFQIPAIATFIAVYLGIASYYTDLALQSHST